MTIKPNIWRPIQRHALRPDEAAASFGVTLGTFKKWEETGIMPHPYKIDGAVLYDAQELASAWEQYKDGAIKPAETETPQPWEE